MQLTMLEKVFGKSAQLTVLEYLLRNQGKTTYLSGISEDTGLSHSSVSRVIAPLTEIGVVKEERIGKMIRTFTLNEESELTKYLISFYKDMNNSLRVKG